MQIQIVTTDKLHQYQNNPRKNDNVVDKMIASINEFGFRIPILAKNDGTIIDGHLRFKAAVRLGMNELPVIFCDDMSEAQIKAFRLMANKSLHWAEWDEELLSLELDDLKKLDFDLNLTGFDTSEIENLMSAEERQTPEEQAIPEVQDDQPKCNSN